jgi:polysaccharide export outer membrane protein
MKKERVLMRVVLAFLFFCGFLASSWAQMTPLQPGDSLQISVWQDPKLDRKVIIGADGMISFPLAGHIHAGGMTTQALENVLRRRLHKNYTGRLDITVSLASVNPEEQDAITPKIYITGEVLKPGPFAIRSSTNVMQALALAGGLGPFAARKRIQIHRQVAGADSTYLFNYDAYVAGTNTQDNINLRAGDVIIVPQRGLFE